MEVLKKLKFGVNVSFKLGLVGLTLIFSMFVLDAWGVINFVKPYVVLSGSMEPKIPTGSLVFVRAKEFGYMLEDVITYKLADKSATVTHRIVSYQVKDNQIVYQTQGDANDTPDPTLVNKQQVIGNVRLVIPKIGFLAKFGSTPKGFVALVVIPATILIYEELKKVKKQTSLIIKSIASSWLGIAILLLGLNSKNTLTVYSDQETSTKNILGASNSFLLDQPKFPKECLNLSTKIKNIIVGTDEADILIGTNKPDLIIGLAGNDIIKAGSSEDCILAGDGHDTVFGGSGEDIIFGQSGNDWIDPGSGIDIVYGGEGDDVVVKSSGDDSLYGEAGADDLEGGSGADYLNGGADFDKLDGGSGKDICHMGENLISCELL